MNELTQRKTERLYLRRMLISDFPSLIKYINNPVIAENILNIPYPYSEEDAIARLNLILKGLKEESRYIFAIVWPRTNELIGEIGLHLDTQNNKAEMGYWVGGPFWGMGIATEAAKEILKFGFDNLRLNKIVATHFLDNPSSGRVLEKIGMVVEAELKDEYYHNETYHTVMRYRMTINEYEAQN